MILYILALLIEFICDWIHVKYFLSISIENILFLKAFFLFISNINRPFLNIKIFPQAYLTLFALGLSMNVLVELSIYKYYLILSIIPFVQAINISGLVFCGIFLLFLRGIIWKTIPLIISSILFGICDYLIKYNQSKNFIGELGFVMTLLLIKHSNFTLLYNPMIVIYCILYILYMNIIVKSYSEISGNLLLTIRLLYLILMCLLNYY